GRGTGSASSVRMRYSIPAFRPLKKLPPAGGNFVAKSPQMAPLPPKNARNSAGALATSCTSGSPSEPRRASLERREHPVPGRPRDVASPADRVPAREHEGFGRTRAGVFSERPVAVCGVFTGTLPHDREQADEVCRRPLGSLGDDAAIRVGEPLLAAGRDDVPR